MVDISYIRDAVSMGGEGHVLEETDVSSDLMGAKIETTEMGSMEKTVLHRHRIRYEGRI